MTTETGPIYVSRTGRKFTDKVECIEADIDNLLIGNETQLDAINYIVHVSMILTAEKRRNLIPEIIELLKQLPEV